MSIEVRTAFAASIDQLELRTAEDGRHMLEGICVPYGTVTQKAGPTPEQFVMGAFSDAVQSQAPIKLMDYNHTKLRPPAGRSVQLEERPAGLWARFAFNRTEQGRDAYENVVESVYGGLSIGFHPIAEEMRAGVRTVTKARLHHVSLVEEPAYDDAVLLSVRSAASEIDAWRAVFAQPEHTPIDTGMPVSFTELIARTARR